MCDPLTAVAVASAGLQYQTAKAQQKAQFVAQKRQNEIARANAIRRYATEQLKIRQAVVRSGSQERLMADYYRTEGNFNSARQRNLGINIAQYERNLEAIQFGQQAQSTYVSPPNPALLFASASLNVANSYYSLEAQKQLMGLQTGSDKKGQLDSLNNFQNNNVTIPV